MYATGYVRPGSVDEAVAAIEAQSEGKFLAGGQTLISTMKQRLAQPELLVDLRHIAALKGIRVEGRRLTIGAGVTHAEVAGSGEIRALCPALTTLAGLIGDPHVRHIGTLGGSIANNDPAADYPAAMLGLGATIITNQREIAADDFFVGLFETALSSAEVIVAVRFEAPDKAGYQKFANPASRFAMTGVFVSRSAGGVRVAVTGAGSDGVFRHQGLEQALAANWSPEAVAAVTVSPDGLMDDLHCSADYRANLIKVMAKRAVAAS